MYVCIYIYTYIHTDKSTKLKMLYWKGIVHLLEMSNSELIIMITIKKLIIMIIMILIIVTIVTTVISWKGIVHLLQMSNS